MIAEPKPQNKKETVVCPVRPHMQPMKGGEKREVGNKSTQDLKKIKAHNRLPNASHPPTFHVLHSPQRVFRQENKGSAQNWRLE